MRFFLILILLFLTGCNHKIDYPTSLFGVKLLDKVTNYMSEEEWKEVIEKDDKEIKWTTKGKYQKNILFNENFLYADGDTGKILIVGGYSTHFISLDKFTNKCREDRKQLLTLLKELKNIKERDFEKKYRIIKSFDSKQKRSDTYKENYSLKFEKENHLYSLSILCNYDYPTGYITGIGNKVSQQVFYYSLTAVDPNKEVTDKDMIKIYEDSRDTNTIKTFNKPLDDDIIKNDFRGL